MPWDTEHRLGFRPTRSPARWRVTLCVFLPPQHRGRSQYVSFSRPVVLRNHKHVRSVGGTALLRATQPAQSIAPLLCGPRGLHITQAHSQEPATHTSLLATSPPCKVLGPTFSTQENNLRAVLPSQLVCGARTTFHGSSVVPCVAPRTAGGKGQWPEKSGGGRVLFQSTQCAYNPGELAQQVPHSSQLLPG